eukprot:TRINITY_DN31677_c0_g1_i1.p1 TRINITY_DN31677_c0_g1~~TRINITY_DN31677_c0_g1_i1.p1  ORF type:complete len:479 (+),score=40.51 TRINITY_DN31677_c0_g1_i1:29-1438(+)
MTPSIVPLVTSLFSVFYGSSPRTDDDASNFIPRRSLRSPCNELNQILERFDSSFDKVWYTRDHTTCPDIGCKSMTDRLNPFFPSVTVLMYRFLKYPGVCVLGSCEEEASAWKNHTQDCGVDACYQRPWFGGDPTGDEVNWDLLFCGPIDGSYFKKYLPDLPECDPLVLTSVDSIKVCIRAAESSGQLNYCSLAVSNRNLHEYYRSIVHVSWHRHLSSTGTPPAGAAVLGFSFGKGANCATISRCSSPGLSNENAGQAAVAYMLQQKHLGQPVKLMLQYEVAVAAKNAIEKATQGTTSWTRHATEPAVLQLHADGQLLEVFALGGLVEGRYLNTMEVYQIGRRLGSNGAVIALAHPDHLPRVYRAMAAGGAAMQNVHLSMSPTNIMWYDTQSEAGKDYNMFAIDDRVFKRMTRPDTMGYYHDSVQQWTRDALVFAVSEFWVYASQMRPGRNDVATLPTDPVTLPTCVLFT